MCVYRPYRCACAPHDRVLEAHISMTSTPLVFLHGFPFHSGMWDAEVNHFDDRPTLAVDFPGFGGRPAGGTDFDDFARDALAQMDDAGIDRAVIVGLSMGGYVLFRLHALAPERVAALVFVDTRAGADDEEGRRGRIEQAERVQKEGVGWMADAQIPKVLGETTRRERPEVVEQVRSMIAGADPEGVVRALTAIRERRDSRPDLAGIGVPVLAIVGEEDTLTPVEESRTIARGVQDGRLEVIPRVGHLANLEDPAAFTAVLEPFLEEIS